MELSIRDWMMVIGVLLLLAVALDGYRRARRERRNQVRLSRNAKRSARRAIEDEREDYLSELPGGGARIVARRDSQSSENSGSDPLSEQIDNAIKKEPTLSLDDDLMDSDNNLIVELANRSSTKENYSVDPLFDDPFKMDAGRKTPSLKAERQVVQPSLFDEDFDSHRRTIPQEIISLNVLASSAEGFAGEDLLHILLACDCRFGEMNIFHRYESENAKGEIQFSIVNIVEPGIFKLDDIKNFTTPGVSFSLCLPGPKDPIEAFNCMVETAQCLVRNLNGKLRDQGRSTVTEQTLEHCRERIRNFLKKQLISV